MSHFNQEEISFLSRQRPYHVEYTSSRSITGVKQHRARLVHWMGDRLGTPGAVGFFEHFFHYFHTKICPQNEKQ